MEKAKASISNNRFVEGDSDGIYLDPQAKVSIRNCTFGEGRLKWWQLWARFQRWKFESEVRKL